MKYLFYDNITRAQFLCKRVFDGSTGEVQSVFNTRNENITKHYNDFCYQKWTVYVV